MYTQETVKAGGWQNSGFLSVAHTYKTHIFTHACMSVSSRRELFRPPPRQLRVVSHSLFLKMWRIKVSSPCQNTHYIQCWWCLFHLFKSNTWSACRFAERISGSLSEQRSPITIASWPCLLSKLASDYNRRRRPPIFWANFYLHKKQNKVTMFWQC